jgi:hypothetical protein
MVAVELEIRMRPSLAANIEVGAVCATTLSLLSHFPKLIVTLHCHHEQRRPNSEEEFKLPIPGILSVEIRVHRTQ